MATQTLAQRQTVINRPPEMQRRHFELIAEIIAKELDGEFREKAAYAFAVYSADHEPELRYPTVPSGLQGLRIHGERQWMMAGRSVRYPKNPSAP
jgi:hypothetical protein